MFYTIFNSPVGALTVSTDGEYITQLHIAGDRYFTNPPETWVYDPAHPLLLQAERELTEYFAGQRQVFTVPVRASGTVFQQVVWKALQHIPYGMTASYTAIARHIDKTRAVRAVASAIGHNPICIIIPCHRVIASDGSLGGFVAGLPCKSHLLFLEKNNKKNTT